MAKKKKVAKASDLQPEGLGKDLQFFIRLKCKNAKQKEFFDLLNDVRNKIVFGTGSAGVGKTYIALAVALKEFSEGRCDKILFITPTAEAGGKATTLGLLPGTISDKIYPYIENLKDTLKKILKTSGNLNYEEVARRMFEEKFIEVKLMNYARGTTYDDAIVIIDEGENFNKSEMLLLLTRMGENTRYFIIGSEQQCDRLDIIREGKSGMSYAFAKIMELDGICGIEFTDNDVVRNPLIGKILKLWG